MYARHRREIKAAFNFRKQIADANARGQCAEGGDFSSFNPPPMLGPWSGVLNHTLAIGQCSFVLCIGSICAV